MCVFEAKVSISWQTANLLTEILDVKKLLKDGFEITVKIFIENQPLTIGPPKITLLFLGTSPVFILPLHSFEKRPNGRRTRVNHFSVVGIATASCKNTRQ